MNHLWAPDGCRTAFIWYHRIHGTHRYADDIVVIHRDGTHRKQIAHTKRFSESDLDWSSRNRLGFSGIRTRLGLLGELFKMRPDGSHVRRLTNNDVTDSQPDWSPGGRRLTFNRNGEVWIMNKSGGEASFVVLGSSPTWAPDGSVIAHFGARGIYTVEPSGNNDTFLANPVNDYISQLDWQARRN